MRTSATVAVVEHLVLHVGLPKTGSSLLQKTLVSSRERLARRGYDLLVRHEFEERTEGAHRRWRLDRTPISALEPVANAVSAGVSRPSLVISHEDLIGSYHCLWRDKVAYPDAAAVLETFRRVLQPERTTVVLYLRRQDRFVESVYLQMVRVASTADDFPDFLSRVRLQNLEFDDLARRVAAGLGPADRLEVRYFEAISELGARRFARRFFAATGTGVAPVFTFNTSAVNRGYSEAALQIARAGNPLLGPEDQVRLRRFLDSTFPNTSHPKPRLLADDERADLLRRFAASNERLHPWVGDTWTDVSPYLLDPRPLAESSAGPDDRERPR